MKKRINIDLPADLLKEIFLVSKEHRTTVTGVIRKVLSFYIESYRKHEIPNTFLLQKCPDLVNDYAMLGAKMLRLFEEKIVIERDNNGNSKDKKEISVKNKVALGLLPLTEQELERRRQKRLASIRNFYAQNPEYLGAREMKKIEKFRVESPVQPISPIDPRYNDDTHILPVAKPEQTNQLKTPHDEDDDIDTTSLFTQTLSRGNNSYSEPKLPSYAKPAPVPAPDVSRLAPHITQPGWTRVNDYWSYRVDDESGQLLVDKSKGYDIYSDPKYREILGSLIM